jgi:hypothetical protein
MSCHSQSVEPSPSLWTTMMSCHDIKLNSSSTPNVGCRWIDIIYPKLCVNNYKIMCPKPSLHFQKQCGKHSCDVG